MSTTFYPIYDFKIVLLTTGNASYDTLPQIDTSHYPVRATSALDAWKDVLHHAEQTRGSSDLQEIQLIGVQTEEETGGSVRQYFVEQTGVKFNPDLYSTPSILKDHENLAYEVD